MTSLGDRMLRAAVALQVAVLERENEDIGISSAHKAIAAISGEISKINKQILKADSE